MISVNLHVFIRPHLTELDEKEREREIRLKYVSLFIEESVLMFMDFQFSEFPRSSWSIVVLRHAEHFFDIQGE